MSESSSVRDSLRVAFRHMGDATTSEQERDSILVAMAECFGGEEGETASSLLMHRRKAASLQLHLAGLLDDQSGKSQGDGKGSANGRDGK